MGVRDVDQRVARAEESKDILELTGALLGGRSLTMDEKGTGGVMVWRKIYIQCAECVCVSEREGGIVRGGGRLGAMRGGSKTESPPTYMLPLGVEDFDEVGNVFRRGRRRQFTRYDKEVHSAQHLGDIIFINFLVAMAMQVAEGVVEVELLLGKGGERGHGRYHG